MKALYAFTKKEWLQTWRSGKFLILLIVFGLFGILNPGIAKLTPWMMEQFSSTLEESGLLLTEINVDALTSWTQFYKNIPMGLIVFLLMFSGILTNELQSGTLIHMITKGLSRKTVILAKVFVMLILWTFSYWMCFGITYGYNAYFWDNSIALHVLYSAFLIYLTGVWLITLMMLMSVLFPSSSGTAVGTGAIVFVSYLLSMIPNFHACLPTTLMSAGGLLSAVNEPSDYHKALCVAIVLTLLQLLGAIWGFNRKKVV